MFLRDAIGRDWQCGTLQVDLNLPGRLGATFVDKDGTKKTPLCFIELCSDHLKIYWYNNRKLCWQITILAKPTQLVVLPIAEEHNKYAKKIFEDIFKEGINCEVDLRNQKINYKIREHSLAKIPYLFICGDKEVKKKSVTIRKLGSEKQEKINLDKAISKIKNIKQITHIILVQKSKPNYFHRKQKISLPRTKSQN